MELEIWKDIAGYENYQASNLGRIRSIKFDKIKILKLSMTIDGYPTVIMCINGKRLCKKVHVLVAITWQGYEPQGRKFCVHHINSIKTDNRSDNLQIVNWRQNTSIERTSKSGLPTGVSFISKRKKYKSGIFINGKVKNLGYFSSVEEAHQAYQTKLNNINNG